MNDDKTELRATSTDEIVNILRQSNGSVVIDTHGLYSRGRVFLRIKDNTVEQITIKNPDGGEKTIKQRTIPEDGLRDVIEQANYFLVWSLQNSPFQDNSTE